MLEATQEREGEGGAPAEHDAPREGGAVATTDAQGVEVLEDAGGADEGAIVVRELTGEHGKDLSVDRGGVVAGAFAGQVALSRHTITLTATQQYGTVRLHDQRAAWPYQKGKVDNDASGAQWPGA